MRRVRREARRLRSGGWIRENQKKTCGISERLSAKAEGKLLQIFKPLRCTAYLHASKKTGRIENGSFCLDGKCHVLFHKAADTCLTSANPPQKPFVEILKIRATGHVQVPVQKILQE